MFPNQFAHFLGVFFAVAVVVVAWKRFTANSIRFTRTITSAENSISMLSSIVLMMECHTNWTANCNPTTTRQNLSLICFRYVFFFAEIRTEGDALNFNFQ